MSEFLIFYILYIQENISAHVNLEHEIDNLCSPKFLRIFAKIFCQREMVDINSCWKPVVFQCKNYLTLKYGCLPGSETLFILNISQNRRVSTLEQAIQSCAVTPRAIKTARRACLKQNLLCQKYKRPLIAINLLVVFLLASPDTFEKYFNLNSKMIQYHP